MTAADETRLMREATSLPETGGAIGPLPHGYVIDVQAVTWRELAKLTGDDHDYRRDELDAETCDSFIYAYNGEGGD